VAAFIVSASAALVVAAALVAAALVAAASADNFEELVDCSELRQLTL
jgi:hypothetical protein